MTEEEELKGEVLVIQVMIAQGRDPEVKTNSIKRFVTCKAKF